MLEDALVASVVAATMSIASTVAIEYFGGVVGGVLASLPLVIVPSSIGLYNARTSIHSFQAVMFTSPIGDAFNVAFLWTWRELPHYLREYSAVSITIATTFAAILAWATLAIPTFLLLHRTQKDLIFLVAIVSISFKVFFGGLACWNLSSAPKVKEHAGLGQLMCRFLAAFTIIFAVVMISTVDEHAAGLLQSFPMLSLCAMAALRMHAGHEVQAGAIGPTMLGGASIALFALLVGVLVPELGLVWGEILAWCASTLCVSVPGFFYIQWRKEVTTRATDQKETESLLV